VIVSHEGVQENIRHARLFNLSLGVIFSTVFVVLLSVPALAELEDAFGDMLWILGACSLLPAMLGFGMHSLTSSPRFLKYANEAVLPFYILHQTVLLVIGYFIVKWAVPDLVKWAIIFVSSFVVIMGIYEYLVRRINLMRFLFGMKPTTEHAPRRASEAILPH
jgi:O-antigen/teichoic acid export membrane protein